MKRIMIVGNCGVGKSTFSKNLGEFTGIALYTNSVELGKKTTAFLKKTEGINLG